MPTFKRTFQVVLLIAISLTGFRATAQLIKEPSYNPAEWTKPYKPFRIVGNLYYVGTYDLACYLITTPQGHILINTGTSGSIPMLCSNVQELGFKFSDIKVLLTTHPHYDHVGAMAEARQITGAKLMVNKYDAQTLADGGFSDYLFGGKYAQFKPVKADHLLSNKDVVTLGGTQLFVLHHPGHTKGANSFLLDVKDGSKWYRVLIANMPKVLDDAELPSMATYPNIGADYAYTYDAMKKLHFDIWLASHASQFGLHEKHEPGDAYDPEVFRDRKGYDEVLDRYHKEYLEKMKGK